ncbi:MAG: hypothetical protein ACPGEG_02695 [Salibacteraceae bacterium]
MSVNVAQENEQQVFKLKVYPNPVRFGTTFWVATRSSGVRSAPEIKYLELLDASFNLLGKKKVKGDGVDVVITDGIPGVYTIVAYDVNGNTHIGKVILKD